MTSFKAGRNYEATDEALDQLSEQNVLGVITLENVIERIMQMDIKDEKDTEHIKRFSSQVPSMAFSQRGMSISKANLNFFRHPSVLYDDDEEDEENTGMVRNLSMN